MNIYERIFEATPDALLVVNRDGNIILANRQAEVLFGYPRNALLGQPVEILLPERLRARHADRRETFLRNPHHRPMGTGVKLLGCRRDGSEFPVDIDLTPIRTGEELFLTCAIREVSDPPRTVEKPRLEEACGRQAPVEPPANEEVLRQFIRHVPAAIAVLDTEMRYVQVSERWLLEHGLEEQEIIGRSYYEVFPEIPERWKAAHRRVLAGAVERCDEDRLERQNGQVEWLRWEARPWHKPDGEIGGIILFSQSITPQKRAEEALRESEARFRGAFDFAAIGMALVAPDGRWLRVNRSLCELVGYSEEELLARDFQSLTHPEDLHTDLALVRRMLEGELPHYQMEKRYLHKQGHVIWGLLSVSLVRSDSGAPLYFVSQIQDITSRKETEQKLREASRSGDELLALLDTLQAEAPVGLAFVDREFRVLRCNDALAELDGFPVEAHLGREVAEIVPQLWPQLELLFRQVLSGSDPISNRELRGETAAHPGETHYWLSSFYPVAIGEEIIGIGVVVNDITERKRAEQALAASEARLRAVVEQMPVLMNAFDENGLLVTWNAECERVTGYTAAEMVGNPRAMEILHPDAEYRERMLAEWKERGDDYRAWPWKVTCKDGTVRTIEWSNATRLTIPGWRTWRIGIDVTDRLKLEEQLLQTQKLYAIGQLAGGIAHDFNNLLTIISGYSEMLLMGMSDRMHPHFLAVSGIKDAAERAALLTRQLLLFGRRAILEPRVLDLNELVERTSNLLSRLIGEHIVLTCSLSPGLECVRVDPSQMEQVLLNLSVNARDAMPQGGQLTIRTRGVTLDPEYCRAHPEARPGRYVELSVSDTGCGMPPHVQEHIFEPYFTTKGPGKGTGLGLPTVYGIVQQSGGFIQVESVVGQGSRFTVYLPAIPEPAAHEPGGSPAPLPGSGAETVLLVEDEAAVRGIARLALQEHGYRVLEAECGEEALRVFSERGNEIDLLVTDLVMPGMNGRRLVEHLQSRRPELPVLFVSGYDDEAAGRHGLSDTIPFLQKPFTPTALAARVREVLDARR